MKIKYCIWHYKRELEIQKNKLYRTEIENSRDLYNYYKYILNLPIINPIYIKDIYYKIKNTLNLNMSNF